MIRSGRMVHQAAATRPSDTANGRALLLMPWRRPRTWSTPAKSVTEGCGCHVAVEAAAPVCHCGLVEHLRGIVEHS